MTNPFVEMLGGASRNKQLEIKDIVNVMRIALDGNQEVTVPHKEGKILCKYIKNIIKNTEELRDAAMEVPHVFEELIQVNEDGSKIVRRSIFPRLQEAIKKIDEMHGET